VAPLNEDVRLVMASDPAIRPSGGAVGLPPSSVVILEGPARDA
jgi:hypothetical protein